MRTVMITEFADPPAPEVTGTMPPEPGGGETLIELIAAEIAPLDRQIAMGNLPGAGPLPIQPGGTGVGRVLSSATLDPGGLVYVGGGPFGMGNSRPGMMAEQIAVPDGAAVPIPEGVEPMLAAAGTSGGISARQALFDYGLLQPGGTVLVLGATGSVGRAACQIAAAHGATVLAGARDTSTLDDLEAVPVSLENLTGEVMAATGGKGAEVIIDPLGGPYLNATILCGAPKARHLLIGYSAGRTTEFTIPLTMIRQHRLMGFHAYQAPPDRYRQVVSEVLDDIAGGILRPIVRLVVPFEEMSAGYASVGGRGRVLVAPKTNS